MRPYNCGVSKSANPGADSAGPPQGSGRILALDVGSRRIGLAVSDALGITAQPLDTLNRTNKRADIAHLKQLIRQHNVAELVLGNPLNMSGQPGAQAEKVAAFAEELR